MMAIGYGDTVTVTLGELTSEVAFILEVGVRAWRESWSRTDGEV